MCQWALVKNSGRQRFGASFGALACASAGAVVAARAAGARARASVLLTGGRPCGKLDPHPAAGARLRARRAPAAASRYHYDYLPDATGDLLILFEVFLASTIATLLMAAQNSSNESLAYACELLVSQFHIKSELARTRSTSTSRAHTGAVCQQLLVKHKVDCF